LVDDLSLFSLKAIYVLSKMLDDEFSIFSPESKTLIPLQGSLTNLMTNVCSDAWSRLARLERSARRAGIVGPKANLLETYSTLERLPRELLAKIIEDITSWRHLLALGLTSGLFWAMAVHRITEVRLRTAAPLAGKQIACIGLDTKTMPEHLASIPASDFGIWAVLTGKRSMRLQV
jgi:hypothetical protein